MGPSDRIKWAFGTLSDAWLDIGGPPPVHALYSVLAVSGIESGYGSHSSNNWGGIQCGHGPPCGEDCFELGDKHSDGTGYVWCYRRWKTPRDGAKGLADLLIRKVGIDVLSRGDMRGLAAAMKRAKWYEAPESKYAEALEIRWRELTSVLGNPAGSAHDGGGGWIVLLIGALGAAALMRRRRG